MKKGAIGVFAVIVVFVLALAWMPVCSQEDIVKLKDAAFGEGQRPPAAFEHDAHNEKAGLDDCSTCHHLYRSGELVEGESSEGMSCSECHNVNEGYPTRPLMKAYHDRCKGCHVTSGSGPITCGECHRRNPDTTLADAH